MSDDQKERFTLMIIGDGALMTYERPLLARHVEIIKAITEGRAVAVPREPTDDMVWDALEITQEDLDEEPHGCMEEAADFRARWARALAASPFAKEGKE